MEKVYRTIELSIAFVIVFALFYFIRFWHPSKTTEPINTITKSDTVIYIDTNKHITINHNLYATSVYTAVPSSKIDTQSIINSYFTKRFIADTINDSLIKISIFDTLYKNSISYRKTKYEFKQPYKTLITYTTIPAPVTQKGFYVGSFLGFNAKQMFYAGIEANYVTHKLNYGLAYDFNNKAVLGKVLLKIGKK